MGTSSKGLYQHDGKLENSLAIHDPFTRSAEVEQFISSEPDGKDKDERMYIKIL